MTPVPWAILAPDLTEQVIGVLLCREHPSATRVRTSQGDGGIDVLVPIHEHQFDVYQIKYFPTALNDSRKQQIRGSLRRITANTEVEVRNWYLTLPLNPSNPERTWFKNATGNSPFHCEWFGLDRVESLAAAHTDVIDYYIRDGRDRLDQSIADLRSLVGLMRPAAGQLVEPADLTETLVTLYRTLNRDDPHYRYEFEVGRPLLPEGEPSRPGLVATASKGSTELAVTHRVFARYLMATQDAPIPISFQVHEEDLDPETIEAWQRTLRFGTPAELMVRNLTSGLPGGLGESIERASVRIGPASSSPMVPFKIRLGILDPDDRLLADAIVDITTVTQGVEGGSRSSGMEHGGSFELEFLVDPATDGPGRKTSFRLAPENPTGKPPAALERGVRFLSQAHHPNRLASGPEFGPLLDNPFKLPQAEPPVNDAFYELIDSLAVLQNNVRADLVVPDLETLESESLWRILRAAALVRGETMRDTWNEQEIEYLPTRELIEGPVQLAIQSTYPLTIGDQEVNIGQVVITWMAAHLSEVPTSDGKSLLTARPALGNNYRLIRRGVIDDVPPIPVPFLNPGE
jgi:hypothetical protein